MVSAVILTKNEEKNIGDCIKSVKWCDEIIVIDDNSTDKTKEIAEKLGVKVFVHDLNNNFSQARNFGLEKAKGDWVLFVDADERVSNSLAYEIGNMLTIQAINAYDGFTVRRVDTMWGKQLHYGENGSARFIRLGKKSAGEWKGEVHEVWGIKRNIGQLKHPLHHYPHQTITEFLQEINYYTTIRAQELYKKKIKVHVWDIVLYPKAKFFVNFFVKRGFLDGIPGLIVAILMSFHSYLVRGKLWLLWHKK